MPCQIGTDIYDKIIDFSLYFFKYTKAVLLDYSVYVNIYSLKKLKQGFIVTPRNHLHIYCLHFQQCEIMCDGFKIH